MDVHSIFGRKRDLIKYRQIVRCNRVSGMLSVSHLVQNILKYRNGLPTKQQRISAELGPKRMVYIHIRALNGIRLDGIHFICIDIAISIIFRVVRNKSIN